MKSFARFAVLFAFLLGSANVAQAMTPALSYASLVATGTVGVRLDQDATSIDPRSAGRFLDIALQYLSASPTARETVACVMQSPRRVLVMINDQHRDEYVPRYNMILWDPRVAVVATNGARISPALGLAHEMRHACSYNQAPRSYTTRVLTRIEGFDTDEERDAIERSEVLIARELGVDERDDHHGRMYLVNSPVDR